MLKFDYDKRIRIALIALASIFFVASVFYITEFFYPQIVGANGISFLVFGLSAISDGVVLILVGHWIKHLPPDKVARRLATIELASNPIITFSVLSLSAIFPLVERDWLYFTNIGTTSFLILARMLVLIFLQSQIKRGQTGLLSVRNHIYIGFAISFIALNYYVFSMVKAQSMDIQIISETGQYAGLSDWFLAITILEIGVGIITLVQSLFMAIANLYTGKKNEVVDLRLNFSYSKKLIAEYDIPFWIGLFANFILFLVAAVSMLTVSMVYAPIATLYGFVLIVRLPGYLWLKRARKIHGDEPRRAFISEHRPLIVASLLFIAYAIICAFYGRLTLERLGDTDYTYFLVFGVFVPWAIIKVILGAREYVQTRKTGDPVKVMNTYIDILVSIYTLAHTLLMIAGKTRFMGLEITAIIFTSLLSLYCLYISIRVLVVGIMGLNGKREKQFSLFWENQFAKHDSSSESEL